MLYRSMNSPIITDEQSQLILGLCFETCDYFSLSIPFPYEENHTMQKELAPYVRKELVTGTWFCYPGCKIPFLVAIYPLHAETISIIKKHYSNIFIQNPNLPDSPNQLLQDLCFFKEDSIILGTVSHESICHIYSPSQEFEKKMLRIYPHWKYSSDNRSQINLKDFGLSTVSQK